MPEVRPMARASFCRAYFGETRETQRHEGGRPKHRFIPLAFVSLCLCVLLISPASRSCRGCTGLCTTRQPNHGLFLGCWCCTASCSGRRTASCAAAAARGCPAIARRSILNHARVGADRVTGTVLL